MALESATYIRNLNAANPTAADPISEGDNHIRLIKSVLKNTFPNLNNAVTATPAELNVLDGSTATTADLNKLAAVTANANQLNLLDGINTVGKPGLVPSGAIILWSGLASEIPSGWALCNGNNGTPDLRDRFVVGAGGKYTVGTKGGKEEIDQVPAHTHGVGNLSVSTAGGHSHTGTTASSGAHTHTAFDIRNFAGSSETQRYQATFQSSGIPGTLRTTDSAGAHTHTFTTSTNGAHTHDLTGNTASAGKATVDIRPPFYALCYIMKR